MTDEDRKLLRENNELLKVINEKLDTLNYIVQVIDYHTNPEINNNGVKDFVINVIANALVGNR